MRAFISYRRADNGPLLERLRHGLVETFGSDNVFYDVDSIPPGTDFRSVLRGRLMRTDAVVAVVGPNYASERLKEPDDYVRYEIATTLAMGIPVVPVLLEGAQMPVADALPPDVAQLAYRNAISLHAGPDLDRDVARVIKALQDAPKLTDAERARTVVVGLPVPAFGPPGASAVAHAAKVTTKSLSSLAKGLIAAGAVTAAAVTGVVVLKSRNEPDRTTAVLPTEVTRAPVSTAGQTPSSTAGTTEAGFAVSLGSTIGPDQPPGAGHIETPGTKDIYHLVARAGQAVYLRTEPAADCHDHDLNMLAVRPDKQTTIDNYNMCNLNVRADLPDSGDYTFTVSDATDWTGTYNLQFIEVHGATNTDDIIATSLGSTIGPDQPAGAGHIETPGTKDIYRLVAQAGQAVHLRTRPVANCDDRDLHVLVVRPDKQTTIDNYKMCNLNVRVELPSSGEYTFTVSDASDWAGTYDLQFATS